MTAPYTPNLEALLALLSGGARTPADATFTTAKGESGIAKARREALEKLHPPTTADRLMQALAKVGIDTKLERPQLDIRESAPHTMTKNLDAKSLDYGEWLRANYGNNGNVLGGRVSDSTALRDMQLPYYNITGTPEQIAATATGNNRNKYTDYRPVMEGDDTPLAEQIARLKAMRARNSNNPG